jgi:hypothetical protein
MQTIVHRVQAAMIGALMPRPSGPTPTPARERELEQEAARLRAKNAKLEAQLQAADDMMGAAGEIIRSLRGLPPMKSPRSSTSSTRSPKAKPPANDEDPEPPTATGPELIARFVARVATMPDMASRAARVLGVPLGTLRRWLDRVLRSEPIWRRRGGVRQPASPAAEREIRDRVRELGPLAGAASLAHSVTGVSRRTAAELKRDELTAIERERRAACARVCVTRPGVLRGFDAMHLDEGYALIAADAAVPFRTSAVRVPTYDARHVAAALDADFTTHGAPLAVRLDRASCHDAGPTASVLRTHRVLVLHGPPHHPQYYGQLERQNREHDVWIAHHTSHDFDRMRSALNRLWLRPTLGWRTAEAIWNERPPLDDDRDRLHDEIQQRIARLRGQGVRDDMAMRLAIEQALIERGYLTITPGRVLRG